METINLGKRAMTDGRTKPIYRDIHGHRQVEIIDRNGVRSLYFGGRYLQSRMTLNAPHLLLLPYTHYMMFSLLLVERPARVLLIGLGAGSLVRFIHHHFPECVIDAVDISEQVIKLAKGYFQLPESSMVRIHCQDGRQFLQQSQIEIGYDIILLDAFDEQGIATHIYTGPVFQRCAASLASGGVLVANLWSGGPVSAKDIDAIIAPILPGGLLLPVPDRGNVISIRLHGNPDWLKINQNRLALKQLHTRYGLDFARMIRVAMRHNLSLGQRLLHLFSF